MLFINDKGGDENFLLYGVDIATGTERSLTPFEKTRVQIVGVSTARQGPHPRRRQQPRSQVARRPQPRPRQPAS